MSDLVDLNIKSAWATMDDADQQWLESCFLTMQGYYLHTFDSTTEKDLGNYTRKIFLQAKINFAWNLNFMHNKSIIIIRR